MPFKFNRFNTIQKAIPQLCIGAVLSFALGCSSSLPTMGGSNSNNTVSGAAGGATAEGENSSLEKCSEALGTLRVFEDQRLAWWGHYRRYYPNLGSTLPVIRMMIQQSNCFVVVERGRSMVAMQEERNLMNSGALRDGSNFGQGQMVAADYTLSPSIQFSQNTGGGSGMISGLMNRGKRALGLPSFGGANASVKNLEAATTLLLIDNRSGVQVSAAVGSAQKRDWSIGGFSFGGGGFGAAKTYSNTPEGKVIMTAFADSFNKMVKALRNYKPQKIKGGLGKGGTLKVSGSDEHRATPVNRYQPQKKMPVRVTQSSQNINVRKRSDLNISIDEYDEDALEDYYNSLKTTIKLLSTFSSSTPEQVEMMNSKMGGSFAMVWSSMGGGHMDTAKIELESWPLEARKQGWAILGKRITKYNKIFNKHRKTIIANKAFDASTISNLTDFELVTEESLFAE